MNTIMRKNDASRVTTKNSMMPIRKPTVRRVMGVCIVGVVKLSAYHFAGDKCLAAQCLRRMQDIVVWSTVEFFLRERAVFSSG